MSEKTKPTFLVPLACQNHRSTETKFSTDRYYLQNEHDLTLVQSVSGRNTCMCGSSHALCYGRVRSCANYNSFASYGGDVIRAYHADKAECQ